MLSVPSKLAPLGYDKSASVNSIGAKGISKREAQAVANSLIVYGAVINNSDTV